MLRILCVLLTLAFLPISANAISTSSITNTNCSGNLTTSLLGGVSFVCAGNLTLDGGLVTSDLLINISADGDLFLDNLTFTAPNVSFSVLSGMMTLNSSVVLNSNSIILTGDVKVNQGVLFNVNAGNGADYSLSTIVPLNAGGTIFTGAGGDLYFGVGSGYNLIPRTNLPVVGGTLVLGSGGIFTTGGNPYSPATLLTAVPEPSTYAMMLAGILGLISFRRSV